MVYVDTSVVVALLAREPATTAVRSWFASLDAPPVTADWCITEVASALSIKVRTRQLTETQAQAARRLFEQLEQGGVRTVPVSRFAFRQAASLASEHLHGLRAGDALHIAVALETTATTVATLDTTMRENAKRLGLKLAQIGD